VGEQRNDKDAYAAIMLGNIYFNNAKYEKFKEKDKEAASREKYQTYLSRALDRYTHVLHKQHNNVYAANGAAAVLFQTGRVLEARQMFSQIREAAADKVPDVWVNLAHAHLVQGEYAAAIKLYQATLDKFFQGNDAELLRCIAHAEYTHSLALNKSKSNVRDPATIVAKQRAMLQRSRRTLQKAMHLSPLDYSLQFNMAVVLKKQAEIVIESTVASHNRYIESQNAGKAFVPEITVEDLHQVQNDLIVMRRIAGRLAKIENEKEFPERERKIATDEYEKYGEEMATILPKYFEAVQDHHREYERHRSAVSEQEQLRYQQEEELRQQAEDEKEAKRRADMVKAQDLQRYTFAACARERARAPPSCMHLQPQTLQAPRPRL